MKMNQVVAGITISAKTDGFEQAKQQTVGLTIATDNLSKGAISLADAYNKSVLKLDAAARAQNQMAREVRLADAVHREGLITLGQLEQHLDVVSRKYGSAAIEVSKYASAIKAAAVNSAQAVNQRLGVQDTFASPTRTQDIAAYGKALDDTRARIVPLFAAGRQYKETLTEINEAAKVGAISEKERVAAIASTKTAFVQQVQTLRSVEPAAKGAAKAIGLTSYEALNFSRQIADVGVSLQAGQSPFTVIVQQGTQMLDIVATMRGTLGGAFQQGIQWAGRFAMSTAGVVTGVTAIGAAALYMGTSFALAQKEIDKALSGVGAASGATRGGINKIAQGAAGGGMSIDDARAAALEFVKTGKIYEENINTATNVTREFARAMGVDTAAAAKTLAEALVDPSKGALDLNKQIGFLDARTLNYIRTLQSQGKLQEAQNALMVAAIPAIGKQGEQVSFLTKVWDTASKNAQQMFNDIGKGFAMLGEVTFGIEGGGFEDMQRLTKATEAQRVAQERLNDLQKQGFPAGLLEPHIAALRNTTAEVDRLTKKMVDANETAGNQRFKDLTLAADGFTRALFPSIENVERLTLAVRTLTAAKQQTEARGGVVDPNQAAALQVAQMQLDLAKEGVGVEQRKAEVFAQNAAMYPQVAASTAQILAQQKDQLIVAGAVGVQAQMQAQYEATINQQKAAGKSLSDAIAIADSQRAIVQAQINAAHQVTMVSLQGQLSVAQQITGIAQINAQHEATINNLKLQGLSTSQATAQADMQRAISLAQVNSEAARTLKSLQNEGEVIRATTDDEKERIKARQTYNDLIDKGVSAERAGAVAQQQLDNANARNTEQSWSVAHDAAVATANAANAVASANAAAAAEAQRLADNYERAHRLLANMPVELLDLMSASAGTDIYAGLYQTKGGGYSQFKPGGYESNLALPAHSPWMATGEFSEGQFQKDVMNAMLGAVNARLVGVGIGGALDALLPGGGGFGGTGIQPEAQTQLIGRLTNLLPDEQKIGYLQKQIDLLQQEPETLVRDELLKQLTDQLKQLTDASKENTNALNAQLDPLFSQGHEYLNQLRIGYYKAATGLSGIVAGSGGTDSTPVHMMLTPGEHIQVTPSRMTGSTSNDNSRHITQNITQNITVAGDTDMRTARQISQGFIGAATRAAA